MRADRLEIEASGTGRWHGRDLPVGKAFAVGIAALLAIGVSLFVAPDARGVLGAALALLMIAIAAVDAREFVIPNALTLTALVVGLGNAAMLAPGDVATGVAIAALRGAALALLFLTLQAGYRRLRGREGLGTGDVKLAGVTGVWLDWFAIPPVIEIAALAAIAYFFHGYLVGRGGAFNLTSRVPFGLFLAPAIWAGWLLETLGAASP
jgi:leader peptidase (prepilin peptidase) / N-methyltransferase